MSTRNSSDSLRPVLAAFLTACAAAAAFAPAGARAAEAGEGKPSPGSGTCAICHTDPRYRAGFSHRGLEESADGCLTCHEGGAKHVAARGGKGSVSVPRTLPPKAERDLCVQCHEEESYAAPKHLEPRGKDARCTDCHTLHGAPAPVRGTVPAAGTAPTLPAGTVAAPGPARSWLRGRVEAGWRFVGGEEARYDQDVNLQQGPRLFALGVEGGSDEADPRAPRFQGSAEGILDPHASARLLARKADEWRVEASARRDERSFAGLDGLHPGETVRESVDAKAGLRLSRIARAGFGWSATDHEADLRGTLFDNGSVVAVEQDLDRRTQETWGSLDLRDDGWRAGVRQGWIYEDGGENRKRDLSVPGSPDSLGFDDDSTMWGPVTSVAAGADLLGGALSVDARASRSDLRSDIYTLEERRSTLGSATITRQQKVDGDAQRQIDLVGVDLALALGRRWALEAGAERRSLREDAEFETATSLDEGSGPTVTRGAGADRVSQRVLRESAGIRYAFANGFTLRGGAESVRDDLDYGPGTAPDREVRSSGGFLGASGPVSGPLSVRAEVRTVRASDVFTPLTPEDRDDARLGAAWRDPKGVRAGADYRFSRLTARDSDLASRGETFRVFGGLGTEDAATFDLSWTIRRLTLEADTLATVGTALAPGRAQSRVRTHVVEGTFGLPLTPRLRLQAGGSWVRETGDLPVRAWDGTVTLRLRTGDSTTLRLQFRRRVFREGGARAPDYGANILEVAVETEF